MNPLTNWAALYQELSQRAADIEGINWIDLWHNQVGFLIEEHPFPAPALFFAFRTLEVTDAGERVQEANVQVDMYYYYETFLDTFQGAYNQADALAYLQTLTELHRVFHASEGDTYTEMTRAGFAPVDTGSAGNLYRISFTCRVLDASATVNYTDTIPGEMTLQQGAPPAIQATNTFIL